MRLTINLASQKYEEVRQFFIRWGITLGSLAALLLLLAALAGISYSRSAKSGQHIKDLQQKIAALQQQRDEFISVDNRPENREVTNQKRYWNSQIARRKFSWTQLFNELQKIMPGQANLDSVQPELGADGRVNLKLVIEAESRKNARELVERMEASKRFRGTHINTETMPKESKTGSPRVRFEIETEYLPDVATPAVMPHRPNTKEGS